MTVVSHGKYLKEKLGPEALADMIDARGFNCDKGIRLVACECDEWGYEFFKIFNARRAKAGKKPVTVEAYKDKVQVCLEGPPKGAVRKKGSKAQPPEKVVFFGN